MNVRDDINKFSLEEDKPILMYLFSRYHYQSKWDFVAKCKLTTHRVWEPTVEGRILYRHYQNTGEPFTAPPESCAWCRMAADPNNASVTACPFHIVSLATETKE